MKKLSAFLVFFNLFLFIAYAQNDTMYIHQQGGIITKIPVNTIDSVVFYPNPGTVITDIDGNLYDTVTIGTHVWLKQNLIVSKLNDGTPIPLVPGDQDWSNLTTPGYCVPTGHPDPNFMKEWGMLYNWYAVNTNKLCPEGWHVSTDTEWTTLV